jgi:hypothetical protein
LEEDLRLTYPSMAGAVNTVRTITSEQDEIDLAAEINDHDLPLKLMQSHEYTRQIFVNSAIHVHKIIALQIVIQKIPYNWTDPEE